MYGLVAIRLSIRPSVSLLSWVREWDVWRRSDHVSTTCHFVLTSYSDRRTHVLGTTLLSSTDSKESELNHHIMDNTIKSDSTQSLSTHIHKILMAATSPIWY